LTTKRITRLLIGVCILAGLTSCHKSQTSQPIGATEAASIKSVALASIAAKYPSLDSSELIFGDMRRETPPVGKQFILVSYILPTPGTTNEYDTPEGKRVKITRKEVNVIMSPSREVQSVSEGAREDIYKVDH
jgi:hypothetical protein